MDTKIEGTETGRVTGEGKGNVAEVQVIRRDQVEEILSGVGAEFFGISFVKRTTGEIRHMSARRGVVKHLRGGEPTYDFGSKNLLPVYDMVKKGYRCIPLDAVLEIRVGGNIYVVRQK